MRIEQLINDCREYLNIRANVEVKFRSKFPRNMNGARGFHNAWIRNKKVVRHVIQVLLETDARNAETIIAHEFVHAWQSECAPNSATHGKRFADTAQKLRLYLLGKGFNIQNDIYCEKTDK